MMLRLCLISLMILGLLCSCGKNDSAPAKPESAAEPQKQEMASPVAPEEPTPAADAEVEAMAEKAVDSVKQQAMTTAEKVYDTAIGAKVYASACASCHTTGIAGAPKLGDRNAWKDRIASGMDALIARAINGYQGESGYMPPKGGKATLTDEEVGHSVAFLVEQSR